MGKQKRYRRIQEAFNEKTGVCYIDVNGVEYTYDDLYSIFCDEIPTANLFKILHGDSPEEELENSWEFKKCPRCQHWMWTEEKGLFKKQEYFCRRCTPLLTDGKIHLWKDPYCDDRRFFVKKEALFQPGLTTLIGCNGIGKSTLLHNIISFLKERGTPYMFFNNLGDNGGEKSFGTLLNKSVESEIDSDEKNDVFNIGYVVNIWKSSEGEKIRESFIRFVKKAIRQIKNNSGYGEYWILFDALDSGLSVDAIDDIKKYVFQKMIEGVPDSIKLYIILSSNSYEMSDGTNMFSVEKVKYVNIKSYNAYKKAVLSSSIYKSKRDHVLEIKAEIYNRDYDYHFDESLAKKYDEYDVSCEGNCAELTLDGYKMILHIKTENNRKSSEYQLYKKDGNDWMQINCKDAPEKFFFRPRSEDEEEKMHEYICRRIFLDQKEV